MGAYVADVTWQYVKLYSAPPPAPQARLLEWILLLVQAFVPFNTFVSITAFRKIKCREMTFAICRGFYLTVCSAQAVILIKSCVADCNFWKISFSMFTGIMLYLFMYVCGQD